MNAVEFARIARGLHEKAGSECRELVYKTDPRGLVWVFPGAFPDKRSGAYRGPGASLRISRGFAWCLKLGLFSYMPERKDRFGDTIHATMRVVNVSNFQGPLAELEQRLRQYQFPQEYAYNERFLRFVLGDLLSRN